MGYPLIILGAGASYDYIHPNDAIRGLEGYRPPLTNSLFDTSRFSGVINNFSETQGLATTILTRLRHGVSLEEILSGLVDASENDVEVKKQLISLEFYLQELFRNISDRYGMQVGNNYHAVLEEIKRNGKEACVVNFNYDTLFDRWWASSITKIEDYINNPIKLIKIHGSWNWRYILSQSEYHNEFIRDAGGSYKYLMKSPLSIGQSSNPNITDDRKILLASDNRYDAPLGNLNVYLYPAIAIPLTNKDSIICPKEHLNELVQSIKRADRILIIGWKAGDKNLIKILEENISKKEVPTIIVSGRNSISQIKGNINHIRSMQIIGEYEEGFSNFTGSPAYINFFSR